MTSVTFYKGENFMQELKPNKKPLYVYWLAALIILVLLNTFVFPLAFKKEVQSVDYDGGKGYRLRNG